jgi:hypothetical protein
MIGMSFVIHNEFWIYATAVTIEESFLSIRMGLVARGANYVIRVGQISSPLPDLGRREKDFEVELSHQWPII